MVSPNASLEDPSGGIQQLPSYSRCDHGSECRSCHHWFHSFYLESAQKNHRDQSTARESKVVANSTVLSRFDLNLAVEVSAEGGEVFAETGLLTTRL